MVPCEALWHMDTTNCNLSKIGSKIIAIHFCETWNRIFKACIALKPERDEKWKPRNSITSDKLCLTSTRHFWKMYRKWQFTIFQVYGFYDFFLFKIMKSTKNPQNSILCTLWYNLYTKHRLRQQLFELAYNLKYYALLFWRVYVQGICLLLLYHHPKQNRSTEGCSKLKRSVDMTSSGKNGLDIRTNASPKWDRTRCPEE